MIPYAPSEAADPTKMTERGFLKGRLEFSFLRRVILELEMLRITWL